MAVVAVFSESNCILGHQVQGYTGNQYKGFNCRTEAEQYMRGVSSSTSGSALLLVPAIPKSSPKKAKSSALVTVKRTRSTSLRPSGPSSIAEVYLGHG